MTEYFRVERPAGRALPIVVDVPHSAEWIPDEAAAQMTLGGQTPRRDLDLYTDRIWSRSAEHGATMVIAQVSRYVVDLNRACDDVSPETVRGGRRLTGPGYYQDRGVVWRTATDGAPIMPGPMSREAFEQRIATFWEPYHAALAEEIARVREQFGYCILVDGHSMPSLGRGGNGEIGRRRADIVPGDARGTSCDRSLTQLVSGHFRDHGYSVKTNDPYKGGWITRHYGQPDQAVHAVQIEVNRDLYMNEVTFEPREAGLEQLTESCAELLPVLGGLKF